MHFFEQLEAAIARNSSILIAGLDPNPELMPARYGDRQNADNLMQCLLDWMQWVIFSTKELVCAYKPTLGFYQALGAPGLELLEQTLAAIPAHIPIILDAKHGDLNTSTRLARTVFEQWRVDAITLSPYAGQDQIAPFLLYPGKAVFVLCCTSNPAAIAVQAYPAPESPLYLQVVRAARTWGTPEQLGLEVGTTKPEVLARVREIAPERLILARSIWQDSTDLGQILTAGLDANGAGMLVPIPQDWLSDEHLNQRIESLREEVNQTRNQIVQAGSSCDLWLSNVCTLNPQPHLDLILQLYDIGCILFGEFKQASGATFPYYIDLRKIISNPRIFHQILKAYAEILQNLSFDRIAGIPYGSLPTATGLALHLNYPMIFPRKEVKAHGTRRVIEGNFQPGERIVVVDDILISGKSVMEGVEKLQSVGLKVQDIVVFLDHEQGVKDRLQANGYKAHAVLTISEAIETLYQAGRVNEAQLKMFAEIQT
jgi:uridine monophosphate synthetase